MALYLVGCNAGYAANGSVLEGIVGMHAALLPSMNATHTREHTPWIIKSCQIGAPHISGLVGTVDSFVMDDALGKETPCNEHI